ncbi:hypothetical protein FB107DRAFT_280155 [Schizophyllum commune]
MEADPPTSQKALALHFVCSSDEERYRIITRHLDTLLDFAENGLGEDVVVRFTLLSTACSMFARYIASAYDFTERYRDIYGSDSPAPTGTRLDVLHHTAGRMGYPVDAARRFFDTLVGDQNVIYQNVVFGIRVPDHPPGQEGLSFSERQLSLNQWYIRDYGVSTVVPYVPVPAPKCEQCIDGSEPCRIYPGASANGCAQCALKSRRCSLLDYGQGDVRQDVQHGLRRLSAAVSQVNSSMGAAGPLPPADARLPPSPPSQAREDD